MGSFLPRAHVTVAITSHRRLVRQPATPGLRTSHGYGRGPPAGDSSARTDPAEAAYAICRVLTAHGATIAPRTFYAWVARPPSARGLWDTTITQVLAGFYEPDADGRRPPEALYGSRKMWAHLQRDGIAVARCTVERLMRINGWRGVTRTRTVRTTVADPTAPRAPDLVDRQFSVAAPDRLVVADFTYVRLAAGGFVYTAFAIDAYAGRIVGWDCATSKHTALVESAIRQAAALRARQGRPLTGDTIHHPDAGSQPGSVRFGESLLLAGMIPSIGSVGDAYDCDDPRAAGLGGLTLVTTDLVSWR